jgi:hypothetical protein
MDTCRSSNNANPMLICMSIVTSADMPWTNMLSTGDYLAQVMRCISPSGLPDALHVYALHCICHYLAHLRL